MMRKRLILRGATAEPPGGHPAPVPCRAHPLHHGLPEGPELAPGHATGHRNSVEGARVTQAGPAGPSENLAETSETLPKRSRVWRGKGNSTGKTCWAVERRQPWLQALRPAAATGRLRWVFHPQLGGPALWLPAGLHRSLKPRFTLCTCPSQGSAFWDVVVADSGRHSVSKARSLTESAERPAGQTEWVTRTPGLQASPSAPPVPAAVPSLFPGGPDGKESTCSAGDLDSTPGWGRPSGGGHGSPLQYSCWRIPWTEEPGGLQSMGSQRFGHD